MNTQTANQAANQTRVYGLTPLKNVSADFKVEQGMRECRIIVKATKEANAGKVSQFCQLPEVTPAFAQAFISHEKGLGLVQDYIASLQNKVVRKVYLENGRSPCDADLMLDALFNVGEAESENVRLTKESIAAWFELTKGKIANFLASTRVDGFEQMDTDAKAQFWANESGLKFIQIASNYKVMFMELAARKPSYLEGVKEKVEMVCAAVMEGTALEEKMLEKLSGVTVATPDDLGL